MAAPVHAFAPATVGNVACGFDVLGLALEAPGDTVRARLDDRPGVRLTSVTGDDGRLPTAAGANSASVAAAVVLGRVARGAGLALDLHKGLPLAGGLGGSAASAVAGALAADAALGAGLDTSALLAAALEGERSACGSPHVDNVAPCLLGGIVLARGGDPNDLVALPVPDGLTVAVVHPHLELATAEARRRLPKSVPLDHLVRQSANLAGLVAGLHRGDLDLVGRSLIDLVAEPVRGPLVPGFAAAKGAALAAGALGASLSGAGPSVFALCRSAADGRQVARAVADAFAREGTAAEPMVSPVAQRGARLLDPSEAKR